MIPGAGGGFAGGYCVNASWRPREAQYFTRRVSMTAAFSVGKAGVGLRGESLWSFCR